MADTLPAHLRAALDQWAAAGRDAAGRVVAQARRNLAAGTDPAVLAWGMSEEWMDSDPQRVAVCAAFAVIALAQQPSHEAGGDGRAA